MDPAKALQCAKCYSIKTKGCCINNVKFSKTSETLPEIQLIIKKTTYKVLFLAALTS